MPQAFSLIPAEVPTVTRGRRNSIYRDVLIDAVEKFDADPNAQSFRLELPDGSKLKSVYASLRAQAKNAEFTGKVTVRSVAGDIYLERGSKRSKK